MGFFKRKIAPPENKENVMEYIAELDRLLEESKKMNNKIRVSLSKSGQNAIQLFLDSNRQPGE